MMLNKVLQTQGEGTVVNKFLAATRSLLTLLIVPILLMAMISCTKLPAVSNGEDNGNTNGEDNSGSMLDKAKDVNAIRSGIYKDFSILNIAGTPNTFKNAQKDTAGTKMYREDMKATKSANLFYLYLSITKAGILEELKILEDTELFVYLMDPETGKVIAEPTSSILYKNITKQVNLYQVAGINPFDEKYGLEGKSFDVLFVYTGSDNNTYYIKLGLKFTYTTA